MACFALKIFPYLHITLHNLFCVQNSLNLSNLRNLSPSRDLFISVQIVENHRKSGSALLASMTTFYQYRTSVLPLTVLIFEMLKLKIFDPILLKCRKESWKKILKRTENSFILLSNLNQSCRSFQIISSPRPWLKQFLMQKHLSIQNSALN